MFQSIWTTVFHAGNGKADALCIQVIQACFQTTAEMLVYQSVINVLKRKWMPVIRNRISE